MYRAAHHLRRALLDGLERAVSVVECLAFWVAIALPFLHVPLLLAVGLTATTTPVLAGLWTLNAAGLVVGSRHSPSSHGPFDLT